MSDLIIGTASQHVYVVQRGVPQKRWDTPLPAFLTKSGDRIYAVSERSDGALVLLADGSSSPIDRIPSGGVGPCHVALHPSKRWLYVANYVDGTASAVELAEDGTFSGNRVDLPHAGTGPNAERQEGPHAHFCAVSPQGRFMVVADLGTDELRAYPLDGEGRPLQTPHLSQLPPGAGPRHFMWIDGGAGLLIAGELTGDIYQATWDEATGEATIVDSVAASSGKLRQLSHIDVVDGYALVGVRGANTIAVLAPRNRKAEGSATDDGAAESGPDESGPWELIAEVPTAAWPRHLAVVDWDGPGVATTRALVVAGEHAGVLGIHPWDPVGSQSAADTQPSGDTQPTKDIQPLGSLAALVPVPVPQCIVQA